VPNYMDDRILAPMWKSSLVNRAQRTREQAEGQCGMTWSTEM